jgi:ABC-type cobalamin transport system permease subunit
MALYNFHRVLIAAAILFDFGFTLYAFRRYDITGSTTDIVMGVVSSIVTVALVAYLIYFNYSVRMLNDRSSRR